MRKFLLVVLCGFAGLTCATIGPQSWLSSYAQEQTATAAPTAPDPLSDDEMEVLVARIALYPDDLVAIIVAASLYPIQVVQGQRYLEQAKTKPELQPDKNWDGSVIALLNYPAVLKMMNDDLDWTLALGDAVINQEKDLLEAIQQLRDQAVAKGVLKSDEKAEVVHQQDNIIIEPAKPNEIYVPVYEPEMLYVPEYIPVPITYYSDPYPSYYYPTAPYFPGFWRGVFWGAVIDWGDWATWGGDSPWDNGGLDIDCNNCFNDGRFDGKINWSDVDWSKIDRSKINFDKSQFGKLDKNKLRDGLKANGRNELRNKGNDLGRNRPSTRPAQGNRQIKDVRKSTLDGLKNKQGSKASKRAQGTGKKASKPAGAGNQRSGGANVSKAKRPSGKVKPGSRPDTRSKKPSPLGDVTRGRNAKTYSNRGARSMGGGAYRSSGPSRYVPPSRSYGGGGMRGGGGGRGGGGRR